ncbi:MAG: sulfatase, partial [Ardenticatenaceae bacterium]
MLILLYVMDSLRRDFLGCYGDTGAATPHLDRFAAGATRYSQAYAPAAWSKASGAALLTGYLPRAIRMRGLLDRLPSDVPTLAERLAAQGYHTVAVTANPFISTDFSLLRGFRHVVEGFRPGALPGESFHFHANHFRRVADGLSVEPEGLVLARSAALHEALDDLLPSDGATFALCWSMDTHAPFFVRGERSLWGNPLDRVIPAADAEWLTGGLRLRDLVSLYRDMVAYNDARFGEVVAMLRARGQWEGSLVIVAGDHGEAFGEHGLMGHTNGLWEEQIGVPLLVKFPRQTEASVCDGVVSLMDVVPTILQPAPVGTGVTVEQGLAGKKDLDGVNGFVKWSGRGGVKGLALQQVLAGEGT